MNCSKQYLSRWYLPVLLFLAVSASFFYGWIYDSSKPRGGMGAFDQTTYTKTAEIIASFQFPQKSHYRDGFRFRLPNILHYQVGYPLLGALGYYVLPADPFLPISYLLLLGSFFFLFFAGRNIFSTPFMLLFLVLVFLWDLNTKTFYHPSELFNMPWNNQVTFFIFCYYFWLFCCFEEKGISNRLWIITALVSGYSVATREENIFFVIPLAISLLIANKCNYRVWLIFFGFFIIGYLPQLIVKYQVLGNVNASGRMHRGKHLSYVALLSDYLSLDRLWVNSIDVLFNSSVRKLEDVRRLSILQSSPWLWLTPPAVFYFFIKQKRNNLLRIFILVSLSLFLFYLAGPNMSAQKLKYHCIRYVIPSFIAFNFVIVYMIQSVFAVCYPSVKKGMPRSVEKT